MNKQQIELFTKSAAAYMTSQLRRPVQISFVDSKQLVFRDFLDTLPSPTCLCSIETTIPGGKMLIHLDPGLAWCIIDLVCGGECSSDKLTRNLTGIERRVIEYSIGPILEAVDNAWDSIAILHNGEIRTESDPQSCHIMHADAEAIVNSFAFTAANISGTMHLCQKKVPHDPSSTDNAFESILTEINNRLSHLEALIGPAEVDVRRTGPFDRIGEYHPRVVAGCLQNEHPQILALVLSFLQSDKAVSIFSGLPRDIQAEVALRMSILSKVSNRMVRMIEREIEQYLDRELVETHLFSDSADTVSRICQ